MKPSEIIQMLKQVRSEGDTFIIVSKSGYTQVGLKPQIGRTINITGAVRFAFDLPYQGKCIHATGEAVQALLDGLEPKRLPVAARPAPKKAAPVVEAIPDFDTMSSEEVIAWIEAHPDDISAAKVV